MKLLFLYGSQTGTSETVAHSLAYDASLRSIACEVIPLDLFPISEFLMPQFAVFVVSTTGEGDAPDNMSSFWRGIMARGLPATLLQSLSYTVFGLGDSGYADFNVVARKLFVRLGQLGASAFYRKGLGDEAHDFAYEAELHPWGQGLWNRLAEIGFQVTEPKTTLQRPRFVAEDAESEEEDKEEQKIRLREKRVISEKFTQTVRLRMQAQEFRPGDTVRVRPRNCEKDVREIMERMGWRNRMVRVRENPEAPYKTVGSLEKTCTLETLLTWHIDLHKPVTRHFIYILSQFAEGLHKEKLAEMSSKTLEGRNEYHRYVTNEHRNAIEVLWDFESVSSIPLDYFLEAIGIMQPREFSIASASGDIDILVSVVKFSTPMGRSIKGLCSTYLAEAQPGDYLYASVHKGRLCIPPMQAPVIFIATGTGISPLWSLLNFRVNAGVYHNLFFFGTRHPDHDFYYREEFEEMGKNGMGQFFFAFSQGRDKKHVQNVIEEEWEIVNSFLMNECYVYMCGKFKNFSKSIKETLIKCLRKQIDGDEAEGFIREMTKKGRFYTENW
jgi:sulfite reductase alpha subunit-like flavoprotein